MNKVKIVRKGEVKLQDLVGAVKRTEGFDTCGAIVVFNGVVRGVGHDGSRVKALSYEAYEDLALRELDRVRLKVMGSRPNLVELLIYHVVDELKPGEDTVFIVAAGAHRDDAFKAAMEALERVKTEVPIWKKEVTERGSVWISSIKP